MAAKQNKPRPQKTQRRIKVQPADYEYQRRPWHRNPVPVSQITLKGHWLVQAGFEANQIVNIKVSNGRLVISKA